MADIRLAHTADLPTRTLSAARDLLRDVFEGELTDEDWEHCLGGMHALAYDESRLVGHAALVMRRLGYAGRALRTGYVEGVGVLAGHRRRGHASALMAALEEVVRGGYELGALASTDEALAFYAGRGWLRWRGETHALTPQGLTRTAEEDDAVFVLPVAGLHLDRTAPLTCDWRLGDLW